MNRPPNPIVPFVFAALSVTGVLVAVLGGSNLGMAGFGLAVAVGAAVLTLASWRRTRAVTAVRPASARWWQVLVGGVGVATTTIVVLNIIGDDHPSHRHHDNGHRAHPRRRASLDPPLA